MDSTIFAALLPLALAVIMFGLGLTLSPADFTRVLKYPKAVLIALTCQLVLLPAICFGLIYVFDLNGVLAVGMILLAASPGGPSANLFSHLAGGNVALNITLTAINSVIAILTLPLMVSLAYSRFISGSTSIGLQPAKFVQVFAIVLVPAAIGMWVRHRWTGWAEARRGAVKVVSVVVIAFLVITTLANKFHAFVDNIGKLGAICLLLSTLSFAIGYLVPRLFKVDTDQAIASAMEIGIHNGALAIAVAATVLHNDTMAVAPATYAVLMNIPAVLAAYLLGRSTLRTDGTAAEAGLTRI